MQNNWKYNFGQISVKFLLSILSVGIRSDFFPKRQLRSVSVSHFWKTISLISTICGVLTRAHLADSWRYTAARISRAFWRRASFPVFWKAVVFFDALSWCLLSVKLQGFVSAWYCGIAIGCCEFKPSVTWLRTHVCSRIAMQRAAGKWQQASGSARWGSFGLLWLTGKGKKRCRDIDSWNDNIHS